MSFPRCKLLAVLSILLALSSCKVDTINYFPPNPASLRYAPFMANADLSNLQVQSSEAFTAVPAYTLTDYLQFDNQQTAFNIFVPAVTTSPVASVTVSLSAKAIYTLVSYGATWAPQTLFQVDDLPNIGDGNTQLRMTNLGYGYPNLSVFVTAPGAVLDANQPTYGLGYGGNTTFQRLPAGTYQVRVAIIGTTTLMYDSGPIDLALGASQGIYLYGVTATHSLSALLGDVGGGTTKALPNHQSAIKTVNAAYQVPNVDMAVDGVPTALNIAYNAASATYAPIVAGQRTITFQATAVPGTDIANTSATFDGSTDSTVLISGPLGALRISTLADFNLPPAGNIARLRVVNAAPDFAAFDVAVDDVVVATNVQYTTASPFQDLNSGNHTIKLYAPGTTTPIYTVDSRAYGGSAVYSVYLMGPAANLQNLITQDNI